ncbi:smg-4/UPF3 family protein isoform X2 [Tasmannia lanceolata]|uniref:smg-4/UPF3 family protein isoform X2 n=1 Tax=Tasmannia lanceolata TaxID=3420 RepID=UPI004063362F
MKDPFNRTKVVMRHLPPAISQSVLVDQINGRFSGRYKWFSFRQGKNSQKNHRYSRAYLEFKRLEDVVEFAEFFDGHVFVNEKGTQFKTIVEYAPSQRCPKPWSKKDGRERTILKDPEYLEFLDLIAKPVENLPSAEIQLERREAERAGAPKETLIITPLMDFVRQKRAAKSGSQRSSNNGKLSRRAGGASAGNSSSSSTKRGSEKRRGPTSMYVLRDNSKSARGKEKSTYLLVPRREEQHLSDKSVLVAAGTGAEILEDETVAVTDGTTSGVSGAIASGKKRLLLPKGKEREVSHASSGESQQSVTSPVRNSSGSTTFKQNQRREASGRIIKSILSNKEPRQNQSAGTAVQSEPQMPTLNIDKDRRLPRPSNTSIPSATCIPDCDTKRTIDDKVVGIDRRTRNKDRPDRGFWTLRRSDGSHASDESLSSSSLPSQLVSDSLEGMSISQQVASGASNIGDDIMNDIDSNNSSSFMKSRNLDIGAHNPGLVCGTDSLSAYDPPLDHGEMKVDILSASRSAEIKTLGSGRSSLPLVENGSHKHVGRRGLVHGLKEVDGPLSLSEGKSSKRGGAIGYGSHEVRKTSMGSKVRFWYLGFLEMLSSNSGDFIWMVGLIRSHSWIRYKSKTVKSLTGAGFITSFKKCCRISVFKARRATSPEAVHKSLVASN